MEQHGLVAVPSATSQQNDVSPPHSLSHTPTQHVVQPLLQPSVQAIAVRVLFEIAIHSAHCADSIYTPVESHPCGRNCELALHVYKLGVVVITDKNDEASGVRGGRMRALHCIRPPHVLLGLCAAGRAFLGRPCIGIRFGSFCCAFVGSCQRLLLSLHARHHPARTQLARANQPTTLTIKCKSSRDNEALVEPAQTQAA